MTGQTAGTGLSLGDSQMARLIAAYDWAATPLGPIAGWPHSLKNVVTMMLRSTTQMAVLWGVEGTMVYNDAFAVVARARHPLLLGQSVYEGWPEMTDFNAHMMHTVLAGGSLTFRDEELVMLRDGVPERIWADLDYSPLLDDAGAPAGVMAVVTETTDRVIAGRQLASQHGRLRAMFDQAPGFIAMMEGPEHEFVLINQAYTRLMGPRDVVGRTVRDAVPEAIATGLLAALDGAYRSGIPFVANAFLFPVQDPDGRVEDHYLDFVYQPVRDAAGAVCGIFAQGSDVTERVLAERALLQTQEEYRRLNDALILANDLLARGGTLAPPPPGSRPAAP